MERGGGRPGVTEAQHLLGRALEVGSPVGDQRFIWGAVQGGDAEPDIRGPCVLN